MIANQRQKSLILQNKKQLSLIQNAEGKGIFVNDFFSPEINEKRQKERAIYKRNQSNTASKLEMSVIKGGLKIAGKKYKP